MYPWTGVFSFFSCAERERQVDETFRCMKHLFKVLSPWYVFSEEIRSYDGKSLTNYFASKYCVEDGKAVITYARPERNSHDYHNVLADICDAHILVQGYKDLNTKNDYQYESIPFDKMKDHFHELCKGSHSFCFTAYRVKDSLYKKECSTGQIKLSKDNGMSYLPISAKSIHIDLAILSQLSYRDNLNEIAYPNQWQYLDSESDMSGFLGYAAKNEELGRLAIIFRGTTQKRDWAFSNICFKVSCTPLQYYSALAFYDKITKKYTSYDVVVTGHSLGGGLAQLISFKKDVEAIFFDAPGIKNVLPKIIFYDTELVGGKKDSITAYVSVANIVNSCCPHAVDNIIELQGDVVNICDENIMDYTLAVHSMDYIVPLFDPETGLARNSKQIHGNELLQLFREQSQRCFSDSLDKEIGDFKKSINNISYSHKVTISESIAVVQYYLVVPNRNSDINQPHYDNLLNYYKSTSEQHIKYKMPCVLSNFSWKLEEEEDSYSVYHLTTSCEIGNDFRYYSDKIKNNMEDEFSVEIVNIDNDIHTEL